METAALWRKRVRLEGIGCVWEIAPGRGRKPRYDAGKQSAVVQATLQTKPQGMTHWGCRLLARAQGVSKNTDHRLWQLHNLKPHLSRTFKLSRDPIFLEKLTDVVGLRLNRPQQALVLCVDEKGQIQAPDRTQLALRLKPGRSGTMTRDHQRHGTTTLFAALSVLDGEVIGRCVPRQRHQEFSTFRRRLDSESPAPLTLHLAMDNYGTHKTPQVQRWLKKHPRLVAHFIPTSSSWLNLVERWFGELTRKAVRRGAFVSVPDLIQAIEAFLAAWNQEPRPFVWTAKVETIMAKLERARSQLETLEPGCTQPRKRRQKEEQQVWSFPGHSTSLLGRSLWLNLGGEGMTLLLAVDQPQTTKDPAPLLRWVRLRIGGHLMLR